jgi:hypothetical protein
MNGELELAALHEAGHCVTALAYGVRPTFAFVRIRNGVVSGGARIPLRTQDAYTRVAVHLAGIAAEVVYTGVSIEAALDSADTDWRRACALLPRPGRVPKLRAIFDEDCALLRRHDGAVRRVAGLLLVNVNERVDGGVLFQEVRLQFRCKKKKPGVGHRAVTR